MKKIVSLVILGIFFVPVGLYGLYRWDSARNRGSEFGYWGEFNRTKNSLASIPGVTLTHKWHNLDVTLEGIGFGLTTNGRQVNIFIRESDAVRTLSRKRAIPLLKDMIARELTNPVPSEPIGMAIDRAGGGLWDE